MSDKHQHRPHGRGSYDDDDDDRHQQRQHQQPRAAASETKRRRQAAVSIASFSSKRGHDRALREYKKRKESNFQRNAALLREYRRTMKTEGYEVGRGASRRRDDGGRKRGRVGGDDGDEDGKEGGKDGEGAPRTGGEGGGTDEHAAAPQHSAKRGREGRRHKSDPLFAARKKAEERRAERVERLNEREERERDEVSKQQSRKARTRKLMKRTRKGQPVMKNVIGDLLGRIKSEVGED